MDIVRINSGLPITTKIEQLNEQIIAVDGKVQQATFNKQEIDALYTDIGLNRKFLRDQNLGSTLATYEGWSHIKAEVGYSIWKYSPTNYLYNAANRVYFDDKSLINKGLADSLNSTPFDYVVLYDTVSYTYETVEAGTENGTEFEVLPSTSDYLYVGNATAFYGAKFEFHTRGSGYNLLFQYWNGSDWTTLSADTNNFVDKTTNFSGDGYISFDSSTVSNWATLAIDGNTKYWLRISTTTVPVTTAKIYYLVPNNSVVGLLAMNNTEIFNESWCFCSLGSDIYVTLRNTGNNGFEGDYFITSSASAELLKDFFIYNHSFLGDYASSAYNTGLPINAPDSEPADAILSAGQITFWIDEAASGGPKLIIKAKLSGSGNEIKTAEISLL